MIRALIFLPAVFFVLGARAQEPAKPAPPPFDPPLLEFRPELKLNDTDKKILSAFVAHAVAFADKLTLDEIKAKKNPEMFAWTDFRTLNCLNIAYELTGNTIYLDKFRDCFRLYREIMRSGTDKYLGWYGSPIPSRVPKDNPDIQIDEIQTNFRAMAILGKWVELARSNPSYAEKNATTIKDYISLMEEHLFPKWDARGFYTDVPKGGVYRGLDFPIEGGVTLSHEKLSIMVDGLLALYRCTKNPIYLQRVLKIGARYKSILSLKDGHYEWMSWVPEGKWDVSPAKPDGWKIGWIAPDPNAEWYIASLSIALNLYQMGLLFNEQDLARFIKTQKERCWNGNLEQPVYRTVAGVSAADSKFVKGRFLSYQIASYDPVLAQLAFAGPHEAEALANIGSPWKGGTNAQDYIREKYLVAPLLAKNPQPWKNQGDQFLADPAHKKFHDSLWFEVKEPGFVTPLKPSEASF